MFYVAPDSASDSDVEILLASSGPCPVCGHPTGDCAGSTPYHGSVTFVPPKRDDPRATFRVPRRVYEETQVGGRKVLKLLHAAGEAITPEEAKRLGLMKP